MKEVKLYTRALCGWRIEAKNYLDAQGVHFKEVDVDRDSAAYEEMQRVSGQRCVPTLVFDGRLLADFDVEQLKEFLSEKG